MEGSGNRPIIVKKKKKMHAEHHGGSWKVAYADFVTAMMAFFLLMWLLAMVSPEKRAAVSQYFRSIDIFKLATAPSGNYFMTGQMVGTRANPGAKSDDLDKSARVKVPIPVKSLSSEDISQRMKSAVAEKLSSVRNQVLVDITGEGVRIQLVDTEGSPIFAAGSSVPTPKAREIVQLVAENIKDLPHRIVIEGHTDASPFRHAGASNWELSTDRASSARRLLESYGIDAGRIARVVGYADQELLVKSDPHDPRNRRISIILLQASSQ